MGTHRTAGVRPADDRDLLMPPSGAFVLAIIGVLVAFIILLVVNLTPQQHPRETIEEVHMLKDGRQVVCLVIPTREHYTMSCDWMTASVIVK